MDNTTKYGLLAVGAVAVYIIAKKQGLADETMGADSYDSYEDLAKNDATLQGYKKRKRTKSRRRSRRA